MTLQIFRKEREKAGDNGKLQGACAGDAKVDWIGEQRQKSLGQLCSKRRKTSGTTRIKIYEHRNTRDCLSKTMANMKDGIRPVRRLTECMIFSQPLKRKAFAIEFTA